jgi:hypothetical protein
MMRWHGWSKEKMGKARGVKEGVATPVERCLACEAVVNRGISLRPHYLDGRS